MTLLQSKCILSIIWEVGKESRCSKKEKPAISSLSGKLLQGRQCDLSLSITKVTSINQATINEFSMKCLRALCCTEFCRNVWEHEVGNYHADYHVE